MGRPVATTHAAIELAAFRLFEDQGFAPTTMGAIATEVGVSKRTIFRYYPSKNDIAWGQFDKTLAPFRRELHRAPPETPVHEAVQHGILQFNRFPSDARPSHRLRMRLILETPELQAHSVLQYAAWRRVIAEYVAQRLACKTSDHLPRLAGHVSLAMALTAYEEWLASPGSDLLALLADGLTGLHRYLRE